MSKSPIITRGWLHFEFFVGLRRAHFYSGGQRRPMTLSIGGLAEASETR